MCAYPQCGKRERHCPHPRISNDADWTQEEHRDQGAPDGDANPPSLSESEDRAENYQSVDQSDGTFDKDVRTKHGVDPREHVRVAGTVKRLEIAIRKLPFEDEL